MVRYLHIVDRFLVAFILLTLIGIGSPLALAAEDASRGTETISNDTLNSADSEETTGAQEATPDLAEVKSDYAIGGMSSRNARAMKRAGIGLRAGMMVSIAKGAGVDAWWQPMSDLQVGLMLGSGKVDLKSAVSQDDSVDTEITKAEVVGRLTLLQARYFVGNSFVLTAGLGQRVVNMDVGVQDKRSNEWATGELDVTSVVLHFGLGNVWTWESGFFIGADWVTASLPLSSSVESDIKTSVNVSDELRQQKDDIKVTGEKFGKATTYQLAVLNVGYTF